MVSEQIEGQKFTTPHSFYDTIELPYPFPNGWEGEFFRDLANKNLDATNLRSPRRISGGETFRLFTIRVAAIHWSGDVVWDKITEAGTIEVRISDRPIVELNLAERRSYEFLRTEVSINETDGKEVKQTFSNPVTITRDDDLIGRIKLTCSPAFSAPQVHEVRLHAIASERRLWKFFPWVVKRTEFDRPEWITRPLKGACLLKLTLVGELDRYAGR